MSTFVIRTKHNKIAILKKLEASFFKIQVYLFSHGLTSSFIKWVVYIPLYLPESSED